MTEQNTDIKEFEIKGHMVRLNRGIPARYFLWANHPGLTPEKRQQEQTSLFYRMLVDIEEFHDDILIPDLIKFMESKEVQAFLSGKNPQ